MVRMRVRPARKAAPAGAKLISGLITNTRFFRTGKGGGKWVNKAIKSTAKKTARSRWRATVGRATSNDYKRTFFKQHPKLKGKVVVHHAVERQILKKYPGKFTPAELHSLQNLRGIPKGKVNGAVHLSAIRKEWNQFYKAHKNPSRQEILDFATKVDLKLGSNFNPPVP